jgi:beta-glucanase (GH16 family)
VAYEGAGNGGVGLRQPSAVSQAEGERRITGRGDVSGGLSLRAEQTYGRWEIRARADRGNGYAPAVLLWPANNNWPAEGEIDISEIPLGDRAESHFTVHWGADNQQTGFASAGDFSQWHTFGVEWAPDHITYYLDGQALHTITDPAAVPRTPMKLAIQNDVGPFSWIPGRDADTPAEVSLRVDWVRVYGP